METVRSRDSWMTRFLRSFFPRSASPDGTDKPEHAFPNPLFAEKGEDFNALVAVSHESAVGSVLCDSAFCEALARLLDASGCGILLRDPISESLHVASATGEWHGEDLGELLRGEGAAWGFAFSQGAAFARRSGGHTELVCAMASAVPEASCVAVPLVSDNERIGGLIVSYAGPSTRPAESLPIIRLLAELVGLHAVADRAKSDRRRQAKQISRLTSDVERMAILLRGLTCSKG